MTQPPRTILVVDDEALLNMSICDLLEHLGYRALSATDGEEALGIIESGETIDLMISDVLMPGILGPELVERVLDLRPDLPIVMMSGYTAGRLKGTKAASFPFLAKPYGKDELVRAIGLAFGASEQRVA